MRKYKILVLTNNPTHAHGAVLKNTFGKRPYAGVTQRVDELILKYDDAEIIIKRYGGGSFHDMRGYRWDEVWIDEYVVGIANDKEQESIINNVFYKTRVYHGDYLTKEFPHYAQRQAINYFSKDDDGYGN